MLTTVEKAITERIVSTALNAGLLVGVCAGDSADIEPTSNLADVLDGAFSYDCLDLILQSKNEEIGFITLNYFNDGLDIISDYSTSLEKFVGGISFKQLTIDL